MRGEQQTDLAKLAERVVACAEDFIGKCPAMTAQRCFFGFPQSISDSYADLWEAVTDYMMARPLDEVSQQ